MQVESGADSRERVLADIRVVDGVRPTLSALQVGLADPQGNPWRLYRVLTHRNMPTRFWLARNSRIIEPYVYDPSFLADAVSARML